MPLITMILGLTLVGLGAVIALEMISGSREVIRHLLSYAIWIGVLFCASLGYVVLR